MRSPSIHFVFVALRREELASEMGASCRFSTLVAHFKQFRGRSTNPLSGDVWVDEV